MNGYLLWVGGFLTGFGFGTYLAWRKVRRIIEGR